MNREIPASALGSHAMALIEKFRARSALVAVVGLGYVGLPLAVRMAEAGFRSLGLDIDADKVARLGAGQTYLKTVPAQKIAGALARGFAATTDFARVREADAIVICVPTPLDDARQPDLSFVIGTVESLLPHLRTGQLLSLESTTYPGTTEEELRPRIESRGFRIGEDFFLVFSPEREDPGNERYTTRTIPKICGGSTPACLAAGLALYGAAIDTVVPVSSTRVAEMAKLLENIHRAVNIGLVNEMKIVADRMGIDIHEVIRAAATKPFGFVPYYPGPGLGGHCIPIDPFYLTWKARQYGVRHALHRARGRGERGDARVGGEQDGRCADAAGRRRCAAAACWCSASPTRRTSTTCASRPRWRSWNCCAAGARSCRTATRTCRSSRKCARMPSTWRARPLTAELLASQDCVIVATDHDAFDYDFIAAHAPLIVDTRGRYAVAAGNIIKA